MTGRYGIDGFSLLCSDCSRFLGGEGRPSGGECEDMYVCVVFFTLRGG